MTPSSLDALSIRLFRAFAFCAVGVIMLGALAYVYVRAPEVAPTRPLFWLEIAGAVALVCVGAWTTHRTLLELDLAQKR